MGFSGNLGEPTSSLAQAKGSSPNPTKEGRREKIGSRSSFIVPLKAGERRPPEPGSREGSGPGEGREPGHGPRYAETRRPVNGPAPSRRRSSVTIAGRTVCGKSARTGLWGRRRVTSGATRQGPDKGCDKGPESELLGQGLVSGLVAATLR